MQRCWSLLLFAVCFGQRVSYFPEQVLEDDYKVKVYSSFLTELHEPSLWESSRSQITESSRFLWIRDFDHPISVRLDAQHDGTAVLSIKISSWHGGNEPGKVIEDRTRKLSLEQTRWFLDKVVELNFWSLPTDLPRVVGVFHLDGAHWILEGVRDTQYHVVDRWSPRKGEVRTLGLAMLVDLAQLKIPDQDVY